MLYECHICFRNFEDPKTPIGTCPTCGSCSTRQRPAPAQQTGPATVAVTEAAKDDAAKAVPAPQAPAPATAPAAASPAPAAPAAPTPEVLASPLPRKKKSGGKKRPSGSKRKSGSSKR